MAIKKRVKAEASTSMASMSDMVFLLLIFFLISSTLINPNALNLLLPKSTNQLPARQNQVSVAITHGQAPSTFQYYVDTRPVPFSSVETLVQQKLMNMEDPVISIYAEGTTPIDEVVKVMNIAKRNRYKAILATSPE